MYLSVSSYILCMLFTGGGLFSASQSAYLNDMMENEFGEFHSHSLIALSQHYTIDGDLDDQGRLSAPTKTC